MAPWSISLRSKFPSTWKKSGSHSAFRPASRFSNHPLSLVLATRKLWGFDTIADCTCLPSSSSNIVDSYILLDIFLFLKPRVEACSAICNFEILLLVECPLCTVCTLTRGMIPDDMIANAISFLQDIPVMIYCPNIWNPPSGKGYGHWFPCGAESLEYSSPSRYAHQRGGQIPHSKLGEQNSWRHHVISPGTKRRITEGYISMWLEKALICLIQPMNPWIGKCFMCALDVCYAIRITVYSSS